MVNEPVDLAERLALFSEHWSPKVVARLNDDEVKVVSRVSSSGTPTRTPTTPRPRG